MIYNAKYKPLLLYNPITSNCRNDFPLNSCTFFSRSPWNLSKSTRLMNFRFTHGGNSRKVGALVSSNFFFFFHFSDLWHWSWMSLVCSRVCGGLLLCKFIVSVSWVFLFFVWELTEWFSLEINWYPFYYFFSSSIVTVLTVNHCLIFIYDFRVK